MPASDFQSLLFLRDVDPADVAAAREPGHFHDLYLDQLVTTVCSGRGVIDLEKFFWVPLIDDEAVRYRQAAIRNTECADVRALVTRFAEAFRQVRLGQRQLAELRVPLQRQRCLLDTVGTYCEVVVRLAEDLGEAGLAAVAYRNLRDHAQALVGSSEFATLRRDHDATLAALDQVTYTLRIHGNRIAVAAYDDQPDLSVEVVDLFARFKEDEQPGRRSRKTYETGFNHVEAQILGHVAEIFPEPFAQLERFSQSHQTFVDRVIGRFGHEANFLLAWVDFKERLANAGLAMCYADLGEEKPFCAEDAFDAALAAHLMDRGEAVVTNSVGLVGGERIMVVTGPNQGGKTTFARMVGQIHYLTSLGCPVPGRGVRVRRPDQVLVHFERQESAVSERGKLQDDLIRMREILDRATPSSVVVLNEVFSSTSSEDASLLARRVLARIADLGCITVCVTFLDELASYGATTVSLVSEVDPDDPGIRTFVVARRPADGRAYAAAIAEKYSLSREAIARRTA